MSEACSIPSRENRNYITQTLILAIFSQCNLRAKASNELSKHHTGNRAIIGQSKQSYLSIILSVAREGQLKCARRNLPHGNVVIDRLCVDYREVDVDAVTRGDSDHPHAILKVRIVGWVTRRINCAIHGGYIPTAESWNRGWLIENIKKHVLDLLQVIKGAFMAICC